MSKASSFSLPSSRPSSSAYFRSAARLADLSIFVSVTMPIVVPGAVE